MNTTRETIAPPPKLLWRETLTRFRSYKGLQRKGKVEPFKSKRYALSMEEPIRLLRSSIPSHKVSSRQPCHQEDALFDTISGETNVLYEKDKQLLVLPFPVDVMAQCIPENSAIQKHQQFKNQQYYHYSIRNDQSLVNKSFRKLIDLSRATTWMIPKAIATATSSASLPAQQRSLSLEEYSNTSDLAPLRLPSFDEFSKGSDMDQLSSFREELTQHSFFNNTKKSYRNNLRFNVHQITSLTSARDLEYELLVKVNQQTVAVRYGQMKKLAKGISSCSLPEDWLSLKVDGSFELSIIISTKPTRPHKMADYLARRGLWPLWLRKKHQEKQQHLDTMSYSHSSCWSSSSDESSSAAAPSSTSLPSTATTALSSPSNGSSSGMMTTGYLNLSSGNDMDLIEDGQHRYRLNKPQPTKNSNHMTSMNIELLIEFLWQPRRSSDRLVTAPSSSKQAPSSLAYPWLRYPDGAFPHLSPDIENEETLLADKDAVHNAITHTAHGDHLTFYLHNLVSPKWERYWVVVKNKRLLVSSTVYKNKAPLYDIDLEPLIQVTKPTEEDQEYVCLNRQVGVVLQFKADNDKITPLGNRIYILADTSTFALHWIRALTMIKVNHQSQTPR